MSLMASMALAAVVFYIGLLALQRSKADTDTLLEVKVPSPFLADNKSYNSICSDMPVEYYITMKPELSSISETDSTSVCYDDLGCFSTAYPWSAFGRIAFFPSDPEEINTEFLLYTRKNPKDFVAIKAGDPDSLQSSDFDGSKKTKFIVHGFIDWGTRAWLTDMAHQFLIQDDVNVFCVDWHGGSQTIYGQATANTRVVGAEIAKMIKFLSAEAKLKLEDTHVIGHSLGAHIAGYAGANLNGTLGRITGIDPANPYFQHMERQVRLDESDAHFVEVLHTDANMIGFGTWQPTGHVDVYLNGGQGQPGCADNEENRQSLLPMMMETTIADFFGKSVACSHNRANEYMTETIGSSCPWRSYRCPTWEIFKTGRCLYCQSDKHNTSCNGVGNKAVKPSDGSYNNMFWIKTGGTAPYCRYHYHIKMVTSEKKNRAQKGKMYFNLFGKKKSTGFLLAITENTVIKPGFTYDFMITTPKNLGPTVSGVEVKWEHAARWYEFRHWQLRTRIIFLKKLTVFSGEHQAEATFCDDSGEGLKSQVSKILSVSC